MTTNTRSATDVMVGRVRSRSTAISLAVEGARMSLRVRRVRDPQRAGARS